MRTHVRPFAHFCAREGACFFKGGPRRADIWFVAPSTVDEVARLRHIVETQRMISSVSLDRDELLHVVAERAQAVTSAAGGVVELAQGEEMVYQGVCGLAEGSLGTRLRITSSFSGRCVRLGVPMRCVDTEYDARVDRTACRKLGIRSMVVVPLMKADASIGVLKVVSQEPDHFSEADVEILQEMAGFIAEAISHAPRYGQKVYNALHDDLTGLPNRHLLVECLEQACLKADREGTPLAVFMLELDGFKQVNDRFGHSAGDQVLRQVGRRLAESVRSGDTLGRLSGDEFVLVCEQVSESDAHGLTARRTAALRRVAESDSRYSDLSASIGLAWRDAEHRSPDELLSAADASMYRVKQAGGA